MSESDPVNHPTYYESKKGFECKDVILEALGTWGYMGFCLGNVLKYVFRHQKKGGTEDLEKAQWYLSEAISVRNETKSTTHGE